MIFRNFEVICHFFAGIFGVDGLLTLSNLVTVVGQSLEKMLGNVLFVEGLNERFWNGSHFKNKRHMVSVAHPFHANHIIRFFQLQALKLGVIGWVSLVRNQAR